MFFKNLMYYQKKLWRKFEILQSAFLFLYFVHIYIYIHRQCQSKCFSCLKQEECLSATRNVQCSVWESVYLPNKVYSPSWTLFLFSVLITVAACCVLSAEIIISKLVALQVYRCWLKKISLKMKKKNVFNVSKNFLTSFTNTLLAMTFQ